jgi:hypothetical protein
VEGGGIAVNEAFGFLTSSVDVDACPWSVREHPWGHSELKLLRASVVENSYTVLVRWSAGAQVPTHRHFGPVHAWTTFGRWRYLEYDWVARPGVYVYEAPGAVHTLHVDDDTEVIFVVQGGQVDLGPAGEVLRYVDASTILDSYRAELAAQGLEFPDALMV